MSMSKKDFIALADAIREHNRVAAARTNVGIDAQPFNWDQLDTLATACKRINPAFMRDRWLEYIAGNCGQNGGRIK